MGRLMNTIYLNGQYMEPHEAKISIFDRAVLFGDAIYEVIPVYNGQVFEADAHLERMKSNLVKVKMDFPQLDWLNLFDQLIQRNGAGDLQIYVQVTRGYQAVRKHDIPAQIEPTIFAFTLHTAYASDAVKRQGLQAYLVEDYRWLRCDIKTTSMLANVLINDEAISHGTHTALLYRGDYLTEGSASNVFIVDQGIIKTPPLDHLCLPGITRAVCLKLIKELNLPFQEEPIPVEALWSASEVWISSTTKELYPITQINQCLVGNGSAGPIWELLNERYKNGVCANV